MIVKRTSPVSGIVNTMMIDVSEEQLSEYAAGGVLIAELLSDLSDAERRFIATGLTSDDMGVSDGTEKLRRANALIEQQLHEDKGA